MSSRILACVLGLGLVLAGLSASALPQRVQHEGLLLDAQGLPRSGAVSLRLALYADPAGGAALWFEEYQLDLVDGYYQVLLGAQAPLGPVLDGSPRYLGISVDGAPELQPRHAVASVPYALLAQDVNGDIHPSSVTVGGRAVIDAEGNWVGPPVPGAGDGVGYDSPDEVLVALRSVDGAGSGVDADLFDGLDSASFVRSNAQVLSLLREVDGPGSGVDADRLDGLDSSAFFQPATPGAASQVLSLVLSVDGAGSGLDADRLDGLDSSAFLQPAAAGADSQVLEMTKRVDGAGSGLDADRLDGIDSTQLLRADRDGTLVGNLEVGGTVSAAAPSADGHLVNRAFLDQALHSSCAILGDDSADSGQDTSQVTPNPDGSVLERLEALQQSVAALQLGGGGAAGTYSETCTDFAALGWASREACLRDGRWHRLGDFTAGVAINATDWALLRSLVGAGAQFKLRWPAVNMALIPVERIILNCGDGRMCFYARREHGTGWMNLGLNVATAGPNRNGSYWIGPPINVTNLDVYFTGTSGATASGDMNYTLFVRPGRWREVGTFGGGVALPDATFEELRTLAYRGAEFRIRAASGVGYDIIHRVVRVIPDCGATCMWFYLRREDDDGGEKTLGMNVSRDGNNGNYWIGDPVGIGNLSNFFSGTSGGIATGNYRYTVYVDD